jgi:eukaryotic-like serine/threonine-protein kinase
MSNEFDRVNQALAGRYRAYHVRGRNGFIIYLAHDLKQDRDVVLWVTRAEPAVSVDVELREASAAAQLDHPHILPLFDSGFAAGFLYYVIPHVEGESLRDRLSREKQLRIEDAVRITGEVADALGYAHEHGVIHRDIKPENVLLARRGSVLVDFDFARRSMVEWEEQTAIGLIVGTPRYMSPEQATGSPDVDRRSDVYSLACVLYEMLSGDPPFDGSNSQAVVAKVIAETPKPIRRLRPNVPVAVAAALDRALAKVPSDRFATALQFAEALQLHGRIRAALLAWIPYIRNVTRNPPGRS